MYYEEKVINGKLCYKTSPSGEWQEIPYELLLTKYLHKKKELDRVHVISEQDGPEQPWEDGTLGEDERYAVKSPNDVHLDIESSGVTVVKDD